MVRAFLESFLARQALVMSRADLERRYPNPWLVWEPGAWIVPAQAPSETQVPTPGPERPREGDALCFELALGPGQSTLTVGRAPESDIVINDATVSRSHLLLSKTTEAWSASVSSARGALADGAWLSPGAVVPLGPGARIQLGQVLLTFHDRDSFLQRVTRAR